MVVGVEIRSSEWTAIKQVVDRLKESFPAVAPDTVTLAVHHSHARYDGRRVRDFVPLLVERDARAELSRLQA
jgi:hypothetical protein